MIEKAVEIKAAVAPEFKQCPAEPRAPAQDADEVTVYLWVDAIVARGAECGFNLKTWADIEAGHGLGTP